MQITKKLKQGFRHFSGCFSMGAEDIILASYPRSGSTWFRTIFANCINLKNGSDSPTSMLDLESVMPVLGFSNLGNKGPDYYRPRLIKTHRLAGEIKPLRPTKIFHLWREPKAVMKSCYRYFGANRNYQVDDLSSMIRDPKLGMPAWKKHYLAWAPAATVVLQYSMMRDHTVEQFSRVMSELGYDELLPFVEGGVELANLENMKKSEKAGIRDPQRFDKSFGSIGGSVSDKTTFSDSDLEYIESVAKGVLPE